METRTTHIHPIFGDKITFIRTSKESNGEFTLGELELVPNGQGTPPHYHLRHSEIFTVFEGELTVLIDKKEIVLKPGETVTVPANTLHNFSNKSNKPVKAHVEIRPGCEGFENCIAIGYGLARDGKCNAKGIVRNIYHLGYLLIISEVRLAGFMSVLMPVFSWLAKKAIKKGMDKELMKKYCI